MALNMSPARFAVLTWADPWLKSAVVINNGYAVFNAIWLPVARKGKSGHVTDIDEFPHELTVIRIPAYRIVPAVTPKPLPVIVKPTCPEVGARDVEILTPGRGMTFICLRLRIITGITCALCLEDGDIQQDGFDARLWGLW
jgi:hypothetical protein